MGVRGDCGEGQEAAAGVERVLRQAASAVTVSCYAQATPVSRAKLWWTRAASATREERREQIGRAHV